MIKEAPLIDLAGLISEWAEELGFQQTGIANANMDTERSHYEEWLQQGYNASMSWLAENSEKRLQPEKLHEGARRVISVRMNYLPDDTLPIQVLKSADKAYVSRYALGRDYHKLIRKKLASLAKKIEQHCTDNHINITPNQRPFVDSAPVLERPLAQQAGLGWIGKHGLVINENDGSWFFIGEILTNLPLPVNTLIADNQCGECEACLKVCPTDAFPKPYVLDARRCISYLTIENKGPIPVEFREAMGNRVFGCDDCQAICPWNKHAKTTSQQDFQPRHGLDSEALLTLFNWTEEQFLKNTEGSAIRRIGYENWLRNLAIGLGNAPSNIETITALKARLKGASKQLSEHLEWAIEQQSTPKRSRTRKIKNTNK